jgi:hypothetical protein
MLESLGPDRARVLAAAAQREASSRFRHYQQLATLADAAGATAPSPAAAPKE